MWAVVIVASGLVLCFAILARFDVFAGSGGAARSVSTPTKQATTTVPQSTDTVTTPTTTPTTPATPATPHHAHASPAKPLPVPSGTLVPGDFGPEVVVLQRALAALGFSPGKPDGGYGFATQTAVAEFQASKGLPADGVAGPQTLVALRQALARRSQH
jgi:peptidoglycan hydrolase-like protein with peptidoglycan-binding domain